MLYARRLILVRLTVQRWQTCQGEPRSNLEPLAKPKRLLHNPGARRAFHGPDVTKSSLPGAESGSAGGVSSRDHASSSMASASRPTSAGGKGALAQGPPHREPCCAAGASGSQAACKLTLYL